MSDRLKPLRIALVVFGLVFVFGVYPLTVVWPSGWNWGESHYLMMIVVVYATLGVFLMLAARDPLANRTLIWFTVWSSVAHALTMAVQSFSAPMHHGHQVGDVPALVLVAAVLAVLIRRAERSPVTADGLGR